MRFDSAAERPQGGTLEEHAYKSRELVEPFPRVLSYHLTLTLSALTNFSQSTTAEDAETYAQLLNESYHFPTG